MNEHEQPLGRIITFYSYKGGTGRTMALANVAWILASNGQRVLVIDWDLESPGLHKYLHPFLVDKQLRDSAGVIEMVRAYASAAVQPAGDGEEVGNLDAATVENLAQVQRYASSLDYAFPNDGVIDLVSAGKQVPAYSAAVSTFNWDDFYDRLGGGTFVDALRRDLRRHYDYVLIDSRTGLSDTAGICTVLLPDVVVDCFTMSTQSIDGAVAVARSIRNLRAEPIQLYPVPMRVEDGELNKLERSRTYARQRFEPVIRALGLPDPDKYWGSVEVPYKIFYAYEEILAAFGDRTRQENSLLAAYERLTGVLAGAPYELPALPEQVRQSWLTEFERRTPTIAISLVISYAARDRMWAEWVAAELDSVGQPSTLAEVRESVDAIEGADRMLVLLSQAYSVAPDASRVLRRGAEREVPGPGQFLVPVRLDGSRVPDPLARGDLVDLTSASAAQARDLLLTALELPESVPGPGRPKEGGSWPRFPAAPPPVWKVPARNPAFTGRHTLLASLRERLVLHTTAVPVALLGLGGVGKTQIALEYAHRFAADYDIVWWISADQPGLVRTDLAKLAAALHVSSSPNTSEQVGAVREALRQGTPSSRWLVIFDNADDPDQLREFLPQGAGDVIVTSRNRAWMQATDCDEVAVFDRDESVELLARRVGSLASADAAAVAERLGDLPLLVEQAAAWLAETAMSALDYVELLDTRLTEVLDEPPPAGYPHSAAVTWRLAMGKLRELRPAAARLLELCAFFAPEPIPLWLLGRQPVTDELLSFERSLGDAALLRASLIRDIGRFALARVDPTLNAVRVHRLVQTVIRDAMTEQARLESRVRVQDILASANAGMQEGGPDNQDNWLRYESIRPHLEHVGALDSRDDAKRQLVIDMVRYLRARGDFFGSQELAEKALEHWQKMFDENDPLGLRLRVYLANTLRDRGLYRESSDISRDVVNRLTRTLEPEHPYTLEALGGLGGDLWFIGEFEQAREVNQRTLAGWRNAVGEDQPRAHSAANNLALANRLFGDFAAALELDLDTLRRKRKLPGTRALDVLYSLDSVGRDLRDTGDYQGSRTQLEAALKLARDALGVDHPQTLRVATNLAVTLRRLGEVDVAYELAGDTLPRLERTLGHHHAETAACALELAFALAVRGQHAEARSRAEDALAQFTSTYGAKHPVALGVANDVAVLRLLAGDHAGARPDLEKAADELFERLDENHPYAQIAQLNLATVRHHLGEFAEARGLDLRTHIRLLDRYGSEHPLTLAAATNLATSLRDTGAADDARTQLDQAVRVLRERYGDHHPDTIAARDGQRITLFIEPPPM